MLYFLQFSTKSRTWDQIWRGRLGLRQTYGRPPQSVYHQDDVLFTRRVTYGHRRKKGGLPTAVIGKWEAFKFSSCPALDVRVMQRSKIKEINAKEQFNFNFLWNITAHPTYLFRVKYRGSWYKKWLQSCWIGKIGMEAFIVVFPQQIYNYSQYSVPPPINHLSTEQKQIIKKDANTTVSPKQWLFEYSGFEASTILQS